MKLSDAGIYALALHEGIVPGPYLDSVGVWTYGIGHTAAAGSPDPAKMRRGMPADLVAALADVAQVFGRDLEAYAAAVDEAVNVPLTQHQFDALVSWHYNTGAVGKASLVRKLNSGDYAGAARGLMEWKIPASIIGRRKDEQELFLHGTYPSGGVPVWGVTDAGKVIWKVKKRLNMPEFLALLRPIAAKPTPTPTTNPLGPLSRLLVALLGMFRKDKA
jgi:lysozyme